MNNVHVSDYTYIPDDAMFYITVEMSRNGYKHEFFCEKSPEEKAPDVVKYRVTNKFGEEKLIHFRMKDARFERVYDVIYDETKEFDWNHDGIINDNDYETYCHWMITEEREQMKAGV